MPKIPLIISFRIAYIRYAWQELSYTFHYSIFAVLFVVWKAKMKFKLLLLEVDQNFISISFQLQIATFCNDCKYQRSDKLLNKLEQLAKETNHQKDKSQELYLIKYSYQKYKKNTLDTFSHFSTSLEIISQYDLLSSNCLNPFCKMVVANIRSRI